MTNLELAKELYDLSCEPDLDYREPYIDALRDQAKELEFSEIPNLLKKLQEEVASDEEDMRILEEADDPDLSDDFSRLALEHLFKLDQVSVLEERK